MRRSCRSNLAPGPRRPGAVPWRLAAGSLLLAVAGTWPLVARLRGGLAGADERMGDRAAELWLERYLARVVGEGAPFPFVQEVSVPVGQDLLSTFYDLLVPALSVPLQVLVPWPWHYNLLVILVAWADVAAVTALARQAGARTGAALALGALGGLCPFFHHALLQGRPVQALFAPLPLLIWALLRFEAGGRARQALAVGAALLLAGGVYRFLGYFCLAVLGVFGLRWGWVFAAERGPWRRESLGAVGGGTRSDTPGRPPAGAWAWVVLVLSTVLALAWLAVPVFREGLRGPLQGWRWGAAVPAPGAMPEDPAATHVAATVDHALSVWHAAVPGADPNLSWSLPLVLLAGVGLVRSRDRATWLLLAGGFYLLTLGPWLRGAGGVLELGGQPVATPLYPFLHRYLPFFSRFHWPQRLVVFVVVALVPSAARGLARIGRRAGGRRHGLVSPVLVGWAFGVAAVRGDWPVPMTPFAEPACYAAMANGGPGAILALPFRYAGRTVAWQPLHGRPLVNPVGAGFDPDRWHPRWRAWVSDTPIVRALESLPLPGWPLPAPDASDTRDLRRAGVRYVIHHPGLLEEALVPEPGLLPVDTEARERRIREMLRAWLGPPLCEGPRAVVHTLVQGEREG